MILERVNLKWLDKKLEQKIRKPSHDTIPLIYYVKNVHICFGLNSNDFLSKN